MRVIGIDPDSKKYGIAIWEYGELKKLSSLGFAEFIGFVDYQKEISNTMPATFVIEDVKANSFIYSRNNKGSRAKVMQIAQSVGMCKQSQTFAEEIIIDCGLKLIHQKPIKGNWAKNKAQFEKVTGWKSRSNEDTRSAAYMAYLHL